MAREWGVGSASVMILAGVILGLLCGRVELKWRAAVRRMMIRGVPIISRGR